MSFEKMPNQENNSDTLNEGLDLLRTQNDELHTEVLSLVSNKEAEHIMKEQFSSSLYTLHEYRTQTLDVLLLSLGEDITEDDINFKKPPSNSGFDETVIIPSLLKKYGRDEYAKIMSNITTIIQELEYVDTVEFQGVYLNIAFNKLEFGKKVVKNVLELGVDYGKNTTLSGEKVLIDYSSPNIAKTMHVGHLRSTVIGKALLNLFESCGALCYGINHLGDWGTTFGQLTTAYELWHDDVAKYISEEDEPVRFLSELYRLIKEEIKKEADQDEKTLTERSRENFLLIEKGAPDKVVLWKKFKDLSLQEFNKIYQRLGIEFDMFLGESFYEDKMDEPVRLAINSGLAGFDTDGALVVAYDKKGRIINTPYDENGALKDGYVQKDGNIYTVDGKPIKTTLLRKSNGGSNYMTRDLAAIDYRLDFFNASQLLYVVGAPQKGHFNDVFELSKSISSYEGNVCKHIPFGMIKLDGSKISSRDGAGGLADLLDELRTKSLQGLDTRYRDEDNSHSAEAIGVGALIYSNLTNNLEKDINFDPETMLDLSVQSGPYIQYTVLRISAMLNKIGFEPIADISSIEAYEYPEELYEIIKILADFPLVIEASANQLKPGLLADYIYNLSKLVNKWYTESNKPGERLVDLDQNDQFYTSHLLHSVSQVIKNGLKILNINIPERM